MGFIVGKKALFGPSYYVKWHFWDPRGPHHSPKPVAMYGAFLSVFGRNMITSTQKALFRAAKQKTQIKPR